MKAHLSIASAIGIGLALMSAFRLAQIFQVKVRNTADADCLSDVGSVVHLCCSSPAVFDPGTWY